MECQANPGPRTGHSRRGRLNPGVIFCAQRTRERTVDARSVSATTVIRGPADVSVHHRPSATHIIGRRGGPDPHPEPPAEGSDNATTPSPSAAHGPSVQHRWECEHTSSAYGA